MNSTHYPSYRVVKEYADDPSAAIDIIVPEPALKQYVDRRLAGLIAEDDHFQKLTLTADCAEIIIERLAAAYGPVVLYVANSRLTVRD